MKPDARRLHLLGQRTKPMPDFSDPIHTIGCPCWTGVFMDEEYLGRDATWGIERTPEMYATVDEATARREGWL